MRQQKLNVAERRWQVPDQRHDVHVQQLLQWVNLVVVSRNAVDAMLAGVSLPIDGEEVLGLRLEFCLELALQDGRLNLLPFLHRHFLAACFKHGRWNGGEE